MFDDINKGKVVNEAKQCAIECLFKDYDRTSKVKEYQWTIEESLKEYFHTIGRLSIALIVFEWIY